MITSSNHQWILETTEETTGTASELLEQPNYGHVLPLEEFHQTPNLEMKKPIKGILKSSNACSQTQSLGRLGRPRTVSFTSSISNRWASQNARLSPMNARPRRRNPTGECCQVNHVWEHVSTSGRQPSAASGEAVLAHGGLAASAVRPGTNARKPHRRTSIDEEEGLSHRKLTVSTNVFKDSADSFLLNAGALSSPFVANNSGCAA